MADAKLTALALGTTPTLFYGEEGGNSRRYSGHLIYNVKDYGAVGDATNDDTAAIQAAVDAALGTGGVVYFPPGDYKVGRAGHVGAIHFPGQSAVGIRVVGCGIYSAIFTNNTQYVFDIDYETLPSPQVNCPVSSFEFLSIRNQDGSFAALTSTETCAGCIHICGGGNGGKLGRGVIGSPRIHNCNFSIVGGIAVYSASQNVSIDNCFCTGGYSGTNAGRAIGYIGNEITVRDCKMGSLGYAIIICGSGGGAGMISNVSCETSGTFISAGYSPCAFLETITAGGNPAGTTSPAGYYQCHALHISMIGTESCGSSDSSDINGTIFINAINFRVENVNLQQKGQTGKAQYGICLAGNVNGTFENITFQTNTDAASTFIHAGISVNNPDGVFFKNVNVAGNGDGSGGPFWQWAVNPPSWFDAVARNILRGASFESCNFRSELALNNLPLYPATASNIGISPVVGLEMWCSDCTTTTAGTKVTASLATNASTTNPSTTLHYASIPSQVVAGWKIYNISDPFSVNGGATVVGAPGGTSLTMSAAPAVGHPIASGHIIAFADPSGGTNRVLLRFDGASWAVA